MCLMRVSLQKIRPFQINSRLFQQLLVNTPEPTELLEISQRIRGLSSAERCDNHFFLDHFPRKLMEKRQLLDFFPRNRVPLVFPGEFLHELSALFAEEPGKFAFFQAIVVNFFRFPLKSRDHKENEFSQGLKTGAFRLQSKTFVIFQAIGGVPSEIRDFHVAVAVQKHVFQAELSGICRGIQQFQREDELSRVESGDVFGKTALFSQHFAETAARAMLNYQVKRAIAHETARYSRDIRTIRQKTQEFQVLLLAKAGKNPRVHGFQHEKLVFSLGFLTHQHETVAVRLFFAQFPLNREILKTFQQFLGSFRGKAGKIRGFARRLEGRTIAGLFYAQKRVFCQLWVEKRLGRLVALEKAGTVAHFLWKCWEIIDFSGFWRKNRSFVGGNTVKVRKNLWK